MEEAAPQSLRAGDAVRQKSARELGASLVLALQRLLKITQIHALDNMAVIQQLDQTSEAIRIFCTRVHGPATFLFAKNTVFVSGQLLKATRTEYEAALELGATLEAVGVTELSIQADVESRDLASFAEAVVTALRDRSRRTILREPSSRIRGRRVDAAALLADAEDLPHDEQIVRAYAQAIVVMRRTLETLAAGRFELPHEAKRIAQKLVMLSEGDTPSFLGVTAMRNANHDAAGRAVNASILAVAMCRLLTEDLSILSRVAMAALLYDVGRPWVIGAARASGPGKLSPEEELRMPAASALVHTLLGGFRLPSMIRTVIDYEAHWHARSAEMGPLYGGERLPAIAARIVAAAHRFNAVLTPDPAARVILTPDDAVAFIRGEAHDEEDQLVVSLLIGAIGLFPTGTVVELSSGELAIVVSSPSHPAEYARPNVRIVTLANGRPARPVEVDLREDPTRVIRRVVTAVDAHVRDQRADVLARAPAPRLPRLGQRRAVPNPASDGDAVPTPRPTDGDAIPTPRTPELDPPPMSRRAPVSRASSIPPSQASGVRPAGVRPSTLPSMPAVSVRRSPPAAAEADPDRDREAAFEPESASFSEHTPSSVTGVFSLIDAKVAATARGTLGKTPLAHLFVYVLDHSLTGTLVLTAVDGGAIQHGVYFEQGIALRAWIPPGVAPLGAMLVECGHLGADQLSDPSLFLASDNEPVLEAELVRGGWVSAEQIEIGRALQLVRRVELLFRLPESSEYAFFANVDLVAPYVGSVSGMVPPLELVLVGLRRRGGDAMRERLLARLGSEPLSIAQGMRGTGFGYDVGEASVFEAIALGGASLPELFANPLLDPEVVRRVVYLLLLTRGLVVGTPASQRPPIDNPPSSR